MFVKICGTTSEEDALLSVALGADAVGFIFATSKRQITYERAGDIIKRLPPEILTVGVFRDHTVEQVIEGVMKSGVRAVQFHGREAPEVLAAVRRALPLVMLKVFPSSSNELRTADTYGADVVMLDAPSPGSGQVFDWRLAEGVPDGVRLLLAGGLNPANVADAIEAVHPWGVDVASGVEASPGRKDPRLLKEFIERAKAAAPTEYERRGQGPYDWQNEVQ